MSGRPAIWPAALARLALRSLIVRDLKRTFRRVVWSGPAAPALPEGPVVLYANHHYVHDTYLLWLLAGRALGRPALVWMEEWDRVPLFGPLGALPFPPGDEKARYRTIRATARQMEQEPDTVLILYPEGTLGPADAGLAPLRADMSRLARVLPGETTWVPAAVHVAWWGEARPTALVAAGTPHATPDGSEVDRLETLMASLRFVRKEDLSGGSSRVLLEGRAGVEERADLGVLRPFFGRPMRRPAGR